MRFQHFAKDARAAVAAAVREEATGDARGLVEAEHLLLALLSDPHLQHLGLDRAELAAALVREEEQSLAAVGVVADGLARASCRRFGSPRLATSAKLAMQPALKVTANRGQRQITAQNFLLGVIGAEHGGVPRALQLGGIDIDELRARL